jgi:protein-S-isoprenylcysteine O-methyltransferase Ste14
MVHRNGVAKVVHADELYIKGMFGLCRNPLYFGNILIYIGAFLLHGAWPIMIGGTALFFTIRLSLTRKTIFKAALARITPHIASTRRAFCPACPTGVIPLAR